MRTPLGWSVRRWITDHRRARAGLPLHPGTGPSRRHALGALLAAPPLFALGCPAPTSLTGNPGNKRVLILGAGLAGLNCCHQLAKAGIHADIVEATERAGGRIYSVSGLFPSAPDRAAELGGEWVNSADEDLLALVSELGLSLVDLYADDRADLFWFSGARVNPSDAFRALGPLVTAIDAALESLPSDDISYATPNGAEELDNTSVDAWLTAQAPGPLADALVRVLMTTDFGRECSDQSTLNLLYYLGSGATEYDERYRVLGGNQQVPNGLAALYGDRLTYGRTASAITRGSDGKYVVTFADGSEEAADILVSALPFAVLRTLTLDLDLPASKRLAIDELGYGTNAKLLLPFTGRPWRASEESGLVETDAGLQAGWDPWDELDGEAGAFANFTGGDHGATLNEGADADRAEEVLAQLDTFWPGARDQWTGEVARQHWPTVPTTLGSYACYRVGQWTTLGGAEAEFVGRLFFCGEHTSSEFQGYMQGAAESGQRAAEEVIEALGGTARRARTVRACRRRPWQRAG